MKSIKHILLILLAISISLLVFQNQGIWQVRFLWLNGEIPAIILLFLTAAAGFIAGITVALIMKRKDKRGENGS